MAELDIIQEAIRRGIELPPEKQEIYDEAVRRGIIEDARPSMMDTAMGYGKAAVEGIKSGGIGLYNMGNDIAAAAEDKFSGWMGVEPEQLDAMRQARATLGIGTPRRTETAMAKADEVIPRYEPKSRGEKYAKALGEFAPGMFMGPGSWPQRIVSGVTAALGSETAGQATEGSYLEPIARFAGAVAGGSAPDIIRRGITPFPVNQARRANIDVLQREGIPLSAGQRTGSKGLGYMESELGGGATARLREAQGEALTRAAGRPAGIDAARLTPDVMRRTYEAVDDTFTALTNSTHVALDNTLQNNLLDDVILYQSIGGTAPAPEQWMNKIAGLASGNARLDGQQYKQLVTELRMLGEASKDPALIRTLRSMRNHLDDAIERSMSGPALESWRTARRQYANLKTLEDAMTGAGSETAEGLVTPGKLRSAVDANTSDRAYLSGQGDLTDLARASSDVMYPLADSGTAGRNRAQNIGAGVTSAVAAGAGYASGAGPLGILGSAALGASVPFAVGRALMSRPAQAYLANQWPPTSGRGMPAAQRMAQAAMGTYPHLREYLVKLLENE